MNYQKKAPGVYVEQVPSGNAPIAGVGTSTAGFVGVVPDTTAVPDGQTLAAVGDVELITNLTEFKNSFGDFSTDWGQSLLAHAVYGFFNNGGTRCFVTRLTAKPGADGKVDYSALSIKTALDLFDPIEEISIVAAPGLSGATAQAELIAFVDPGAHPSSTRFALLDTAEVVNDYGKALAADKLPGTSLCAALYFPWLGVYDPATKDDIFVPPSGHVAGIYARVDATRGVHKAPANETVLGAKGLKYAISREQQDGLNPQGVNCIRKLNSNVTVWGARTLGGEKNLDFRYINVRRVFNFLHGSIDQGTQWAVFEPNNPDLWAKITRNVSAFLRDVWASGALFGDKPEQAYYVKCDGETNPPSARDLGMVTTEVGVAITRPAEFVIFRLGQKAAS
jgi:hypothetical protein